MIDHFEEKLTVISILESRHLACKFGTIHLPNGTCQQCLLLSVPLVTHRIVAEDFNRKRKFQSLPANKNWDRIKAKCAMEEDPQVIIENPNEVQLPGKIFGLESQGSQLAQSHFMAKLPNVRASDSPRFLTIELSVTAEIHRG